MHRAIAERRSKVIRDKRELLRDKLAVMGASIELAGRSTQDPTLEKLGLLYQHLVQEMVNKGFPDEALDSLYKAVKSTEAVIQIVATQLSHKQTKSK